MRKILVLGASGFIGNHLIRKHKLINDYVCGIDIRKSKYNPIADEFYVGDLRNKLFVEEHIKNKNWDLVYHFAADMGGAGYIFTKENDADIMSNSLTITINILQALKNTKQTLIYASSACVYPEHNQLDIDNLKITEDSAYPANPDSCYGWEKLTGEKLCQSFNYNYNMDNKIVRIHNVYGPFCDYNTGREKSPAALCRKIAESTNNKIKIWGDGKQIRSFLFISDFLDALDKVIECNVCTPVNVGNENYVSINDLAKLLINISNKNIEIEYEVGPIGVNARTSDNTLIKKLTGWEPKISLENGMKTLYYWIENEIKKEK